LLMEQLLLERERLHESQVELEVSRDHYSELFDLAPVGYMTLSKAGVVLTINSTGTRILGRPRHDLVTWPAITTVHNFDRRKFLRHLQLCAEQSGCVTTELRLSTDNSDRPGWIELVSVATHTEPAEGGPATLQLKCVFTDITTRKRAEASLRQSEERFHSLADAAPVLIWISGIDKQCTYFNRRWLEFTGRAMEKEIGSGWAEGVHRDDKARCLEIYDTAFGARMQFKMEYRLRRHDGEYRWMLDNGVPYFGPEHDFRGFIGSCIDITERRRMEEALESASRLPLENPSAVMRLERGGIVSFANPAARAVLKHWKTVLGRQAPASVVRTAVRALSRKERQVQDVTVRRRKFQVAFAPSPRSDYVNLYFSDVTDRDRAVRALKKAHQELEERVRKRTLALSRSNAALQKEMAARLKADHSLRESQERLNMVVQGTRDYAIIMLDAEGRVNSWNAGAREITGYRAAEMHGRHFSRFYTPSDLLCHKPQRLLNAARLQGRAEDEGWRVRKNGSRFWASVILTALHDKEGRLRGFSKVTRDITQARLTQEALRLSEKNLTDFFHKSPLGFLWINRGGRILRLNKVAQELLGLPSPERGHRVIQEFDANRGVTTDILKRLVSGQDVQNCRARFRRRDGGVRHVLIDANGLWENERLVHSRWFVRDITRRVELEREVLVVAERERQRIGHALHDDLCQQLTGIEFLSQTLAGQLAGVSAANAGRAREIAQMVRKAIDHTRELAHGLAPVQLETLGLTGALEELAERTRKFFKIDCRFRSNARAWSHDPALGIHLYRIAQEAVSNAVKHGRAKSVEIGLVRNRYRLVLAVTDNGVGLPLKPRKVKGAGLRVMGYRAGAIHGNLVVRRSRNGGTTVTCTVSDAFSSRKSREVYEIQPKTHKYHG
jgi:PAS domain S-box-containing protein